MPKKLLTQISPEHLVGIAKHVEEFAATCRAVAATMQGDELQTIPVASWQQTGGAIGNLDAFVSALRDALAAARVERGDMPQLPPSQRWSKKDKHGVPDSPKKRAGK
jgi:hypothetical protein